MVLFAVLWAFVVGLIIGWVAKQYSKMEKMPKKALVIITVLLLWTTVVVLPVGLRVALLNVFLMMWGMTSIVLERVIAPYALFSVSFWKEVCALEKRKV